MRSSERSSHRALTAPLRLLTTVNKIDRVHYSREITLDAQRSAEKLPWDASPPSAALLAYSPSLLSLVPSHSRPPSSSDAFPSSSLHRGLWLLLPRLPRTPHSTPTNSALLCVLRKYVYAQSV